MDNYVFICHSLCHIIDAIYKCRAVAILALSEGLRLRRRSQCSCQKEHYNIFSSDYFLYVDMDNHGFLAALLLDEFALIKYII